MTSSWIILVKCWQFPRKNIDHYLPHPIQTFCSSTTSFLFDKSNKYSKRNLDHEDLTNCSPHDFIPRWSVLCVAKVYCKYLSSSSAVDSHHDNWDFIVLHLPIDIVTDDYHVSNLVRSDSIVSIFLESVLLVNCHSYFSNRYHPKLAVYVCRCPCAQWSQRRRNSVPSLSTSRAYFVKIHPCLPSSSPSLVFDKQIIHVPFSHLSVNVLVHLNLFLHWS